MIRFKLKSKDKSQADYNFIGLGCDGVVSFDLSKNLASLKECEWRHGLGRDEKYEGRVLLAAKKIAKSNYPQTFTYATH